jgi:hypothetical protein
MNSTLPRDYLERMAENDPEAYRSEALGEFRPGIAALLDPDAIDACVVRGVREVAPAAGLGYRAHFDPSGGRADAAALAIAHRDEAEVVHVDLARRWPAPHNPETVIADAAEALRRYGVTEVQVDRFAGDFPLRAFERCGVRACVAEGTTSEHCLGLVPIVNTAAVALLDVPDLLRELRGLERRRGPSGRDRVDHRPGAHDDLAAAVAGATVLCSGVGEQPIRQVPILLG